MLRTREVEDEYREWISIVKGIRTRRRARTIPKEEIRPAEVLVKGKRRLKVNPETKKCQRS